MPPFAAPAPGTPPLGTPPFGRPPLGTPKAGLRVGVNPGLRLGLRFGVKRPGGRMGWFTGSPGDCGRAGTSPACRIAGPDPSASVWPRSPSPAPSSSSSGEKEDE
jgi:hypothetical protein